MAFKLTPISCDREGSELRVRGHVLSGAYFGPEPVQDGEYPLSFARDLISKMPGVSPANAEAMAKTLLANLSVEGLKWTQDDGLGWTNIGDTARETRTAY